MISWCCIDRLSWQRLSGVGIQQSVGEWRSQRAPNVRIFKAQTPRRRRRVSSPHLLTYRWVQHKSREQVSWFGAKSELQHEIHVIEAHPCFGSIIEVVSLPRQMSPDAAQAL